MLLISTPKASQEIALAKGFISCVPEPFVGYTALTWKLRIEWGPKDVNYSILNRHWLGPILVLFFLGPPQAAKACSCAPYPDDLEKAVTMAYAQADVVFLGDITAMRNADLGILRQREVTFSVRDRWKGSISDITPVRTNIGEIACGYNFKKRNSYLVFAHWDQQRQHLTTSFCDLTRTEDEAKSAISVLGRLTKRGGFGGVAQWRMSRVGYRFGSLAAF